MIRPAGEVYVRHCSSFTSLKILKRHSHVTCTAIEEMLLKINDTFYSLSFIKWLFLENMADANFQGPYSVAFGYDNIIQQSHTEK